MALDKIKLDGSENGESVATKINLGFDAIDTITYGIVEDTGKIEYKPDFSQAYNFIYTITNDNTLIVNPDIITRGLDGYIVLKIDPSATHSVSFDTSYYFPLGAPLINTDPGAVNIFRYFICDNSYLFMEYIADYVK
jgi:hypothetical protein